ncbi:MAG: hypothetical protein Q7J35_02390 [Candidatus Methanoperedens sp.]|nr:hypothetical protein [Candidatus Methanoperedens sp.]
MSLPWLIVKKGITKNEYQQIIWNYTKWINNKVIILHNKTDNEIGYRISLEHKDFEPHEISGTLGKNFRVIFKENMVPDYEFREYDPFPNRIKLEVKSAKPGSHANYEICCSGTIAPWTLAGISVLFAIISLILATLSIIINLKRGA